MPISRLYTVLLASLMVFTPFAAHAQVKAQLPYSVVANYLEMFDSLKHLDLIVPSMMVSSIDPGVSAAGIEFRVNDAGKWHSFTTDENGTIVFPNRPDWLDLVLLTDQPKGTLQLLVGFSARPLSGNSMPYQELLSLVPQFDEAMAALARKQGQQPQEVKGLTVQFEDGTGGVNILAKRKKMLKANSAGTVVLHYNQALWQENPTVEFKQSPIGIVPLQ